MLEKILEIIPKDKLAKGKWYLGRGRNSNIGYWTGKSFLTIGFKFNEPVIKVEPYYTETEGCFQPFLQIDEGKMIAPFGKTGWDAHYGKTLRIKLE